MILYLHGFRSSPQSAKVQALAAYLAARGQADQLICPLLSHIPELAIAQAEAVLDAHPERPFTLIGSSLGGFYATCLAERRRLRAALINPAVPARLDLTAWIGEHDNFHSGERFVFTADHVAQISRLDPPTLNPDRYLLLVEQGDETLDYRDAVNRYRGARQIVEPGGDHGFSRFAACLPELAAFAGL